MNDKVTKEEVSKFIETYDYRESVKEDIRNYIKCNYASIESLDRDIIYDELFVGDSVTGNASGSYTCDTTKARSYIIGNEDLVKEAIEEFCCTPETIVDHLFDYEWMDVTVRCYLLGECLDDVLGKIQEEGWPD